MFCGVEALPEGLIGLIIIGGVVEMSWMVTMVDKVALGVVIRPEPDMLVRIESVLNVEGLMDAVVLV